MLERFTDRARKVMALANEHALRTNSEYIFPEHIACGIIDERECSAAKLLLKGRVDLDELRQELETLIQPGDKKSAAKYLPETKGAKNVILRAVEESKAIGNNFVGTEHYFLGFLRDPQIPTCQLLTRRGIELETMRQNVKQRNEEYVRDNPLRLRIREILLNDWDPRNIAARPEVHRSYDAYLDPIINLLRTNVDEGAIIKFLKQKEQELMCFSSVDTARLRPAARKLLMLR